VAVHQRPMKIRAQSSPFAARPGTVGIGKAAGGKKK
jgi:hypothetical protein